MLILGAGIQPPFEIERIVIVFRRVRFTLEDIAPHVAFSGSRLATFYGNRLTTFVGLGTGFEVIVDDVGLIVAEVGSADPVVDYVVAEIQVRMPIH